jgi:hypothetical protein
MKLLRKKKTRSDFDGFEYRVLVRLSAVESRDPREALDREFYIEPCGHSYDCCGCICHCYVTNVVQVSARKVKATVTYYYNV